MAANDYFQQLNTDYLAVAEPKEDLYWSNYMGTSDTMAELTEAETNYNHFVSNPQRLAELRKQVTAAESLHEGAAESDLLHGLRGWLHFFSVNAIESQEARAMEEALVQDDSNMFERRKALSLHYLDTEGEAVEASTLVLSTNLLSCDDEAVRRSSHAGLLTLERFVAENGFVDMVKRRNAFARMGVKFRGASLTLDLLDRKGKYENGFMHAPRVAWIRDGVWSPALINFTSNANPDQVGSGNDGINTLFHEGGHAAHFANITQNAPCFSQESPPTAMSYAETQSMFFDSMLGDADWLKRYARDRAGAEIPNEIIHQQINSSQPMAAYRERGILVVPYYEWSIYSAEEGELTADYLVSQARYWENKIFGLECAPRPILSIPHLLDQTGACSYQGYLLANMAVYQTRAWFLREYGYLTDNPHIGELLSKHYWEPGNSVSHSDTLLSLTGEGFSGQYLADFCNRSVDEAWEDAQAVISGAQARDIPRLQSLDAKIRAVHGTETIASNEESDRAMYSAFEQWVESRYS